MLIFTDLCDFHLSCRKLSIGILVFDLSSSSDGNELMVHRDLELSQRFVFRSYHWFCVYIEKSGFGLNSVPLA